VLSKYCDRRESLELAIAKITEMFTLAELWEWDGVVTNSLIDVADWRWIEKISVR